MPQGLMLRARALFLVVTAIMIAAIALPARANYPERSIKIIVAYAPGGTNDILARLVAE